MTGLFIGVGILLLITYFIQGFNMVSVVSTITAIIFCSRKVGHFCKLSTLVIWECLGIFFALMVKLAFSKVTVIWLGVTILVRLAFILLSYHEIKEYVYVKEIHRKD